MSSPFGPMHNMKYHIYILRCSDETLYTGITNNLEKRLHQHNFLKSGAKYTRSRRPVELVYQETLEDKSSAQKREYALKCLTREQKLELISEQ